MIPRGLIYLTTALLTLPASQVARAASAPIPPAPLVRIETVTHNARAPLRAGDQITVSLRGSGGGSATFHIFGVTADIGMREIRSGTYVPAPPATTLYTGTYVIRPGDTTRNAAIFATLAGRGMEVMAASPRSVTIDARPPVITSRHPKPGARLSNIRPNIAIDVLDLETAVNPASVRLLVNGQNVTARASISETLVAYNPETAFQPGTVRVQLTVADRARNTLQAKWTFQIDPPGELIRSVTINPASALTRDDVLTVVMTGAPGSKASFTIQGIRSVVSMRESQTPGIYFGTLVVRPQLAVAEALLLVTLEKNGRQTTVPAAVPVTILPVPPPAPGIISPNRAISFENAATGRLALSGSSRPGFRILGRIAYEVGSQALEAEGILGEFVAVAGANGRWQVSIGPLVPLERARVIVTVVAIDPAGQRSPPTTIELNSN